MSFFNASKQRNIYFDYTAGRGPYENEYKENEVNTPTQSSLYEPKKIINEVQTNNNHATFEKFSENQPHRLYHLNCNQFQEKRRFSYSRGQNRARTYGRNNFQIQNETVSENSFHYSNTNSYNENKSQHHQNSALNWSPTPTSFKK